METLDMPHARTEARVAVRVVSVKEIALDIKSFELAGTREPLPSFAAGAHVILYLGDGLQRQYSLCNDPRDQNLYRIAVLKERASRGGSLYLHENVATGDVFDISFPRNHFELVSGAARYTLIAGGIGIAPILSMVRELRARSAEFALHYCARSAANAAFTDELTRLCKSGQARMHFDGGNPQAGLNVAELLREMQHGTHVYCCGPAALMRAVKETTVHWPADHVHFESFAASDVAGTEENGFEVLLRRHGLRLRVPKFKTIVQVLRENAIDVETSCEAGTCGTCKTRYTGGHPIHNDYVLSDEEKAEFVMICCARAIGALELEI